MKNAKGLIILVCIMALLIGAYFLVDSGVLNKKAEKPDDTSTTVPKVDLTITKWTEPASKISIQNQNGTFSFTRSVEWNCEEYPSYPISSTVLSDMAAILGGLTGTRRLPKNDDNIKNFGLDKPTAQIVFSKNGTEAETLVVGNKNQATTDYYVMLQSKDAIFMMESGYIDYFLGDSIYYVDVPELPDLQVDGVTLFRYKSPKGSFELTKTHSNNAKHTNLISGISSLYVTAVVDPYTEDLAKYGLEDPHTVAYAEYRTTDSEGIQSAPQTFEIKVGDIYPEDDRYYYVTVSIHPNTVYRMFSGSLSNLTNPADVLVQ